MLYFSWPPVSVTIPGVSTAAKQDDQITLETAGNASLSSIDSKVSTGNTSLASIDTKLSSQATAANQGTANTSLASIDTKLSSVATAANQSTAITSLASIDTKLSSQATAANQTAQQTLIGAVTETAPASDTASSGLNGRLQRVAQRLTSLIGLLPTSLGQKTMANGLAVTIASDQSAVPVSGTFWQATQPVSGTVTANAGTGTFAVSGTVTANAGTGTFATSATQSGTWTVQPGNTANTTPWLFKTSGKTAVNKVRNDYTSTSVTTGAYVQLLSAAQFTTACTEVEVFDSSGQTLVLATGAAASEVDQVYILPGGNGRIPLAIAASTRISVKAVSASASVGELTINFYG